MNTNSLRLGEQTLIIVDRNGNIFSLNKKILEKILKSNKDTKFILVTDNNNNISIVSADSSAKEILSNENELERLNLKLNDIKTDIKTIKTDSWTAETINFITYTLDILLSLFLVSLLGFPAAFSLVTLFHLTMKVANTICHGTRIGRFTRKHYNYQNSIQRNCAIPTINRRFETQTKQCDD